MPIVSVTCKLFSYTAAYPFMSGIIYRFLLLGTLNVEKVI